MWWKRGRTDDLRPQRVWALRKDGHEAAIDLKAVPGVGGEIVLTHGGWGDAQDAPVPVTRAAGAGQGDSGHAGDVGGERVGVMKFNPRIVRRAEGVMVAGVIVLVLVAYRISKALTRRSGSLE